GTGRLGLAEPYRKHFLDLGGLGRQAARIAAHLRQLHSLDAPFCDDEVLDACLSVRAHDAGDASSYKPLLAEAMRGLVPEEILRRTTKDGCGLDWHAGLKAHQRELAAWADDSRLVAAGLADPDELRRALLSPGLAPGGCAVLEATLGVEAWLRDLEAHPVPADLRQHPKGEEHHDDATPAP
ncbi:asparagine synthase-related protein, partial [Nonomuraea sp. NPDC004297]